MYGGAELLLHAFSILTLCGGEKKASRSGRFTTGDTAYSSHGVGG
jgi:hypothetical protein